MIPHGNASARMTTMTGWTANSPRRRREQDGRAGWPGSVGGSSKRRSSGADGAELAILRWGGRQRRRFALVGARRAGQCALQPAPGLGCHQMGGAPAHPGYALAVGIEPPPQNRYEEIRQRVRRHYRRRNRLITHLFMFIGGNIALWGASLGRYYYYSWKERPCCKVWQSCVCYLGGAAVFPLHPGADG